VYDIHICLCMILYIYSYMKIYVYIYICICKSIFTSTCICIYTYACMSLDVLIRAPTYVHTRMRTHPESIRFSSQTHSLWPRTVLSASQKQVSKFLCVRESARARERTRARSRERASVRLLKAIWISKRFVCVRAKVTDLLNSRKSVTLWLTDIVNVRIRQACVVVHRLHFHVLHIEKTQHTHTQHTHSRYISLRNSNLTNQTCKSDSWRWKYVFPPPIRWKRTAARKPKRVQWNLENDDEEGKKKDDKKTGSESMCVFIHTHTHIYIHINFCIFTSW